jgi:hypothetical protein
LYFVQRIVVHQWLRRRVVALLGAGIRLYRRTAVAGHAAAGPAIGTSRRPSENDAALAQLEASGFTPLPPLLTAHQIDEMHAFLKDKRVVDRRNHACSFLPCEAPAGVPMADYTMSDILACPHLLAMANDPRLLALAAGYIGCTPTISAIMLRWSYPNDAPGRTVQAFHRDSDDWRFLKVFVYLTDVDEGSGPHVYVRGTHRHNATLRLKTFTDQAIEEAYGDARLVVTGQRGYAFAADTYGVHKGMVPTTTPRLLLQIQYSLLPVYAYAYRPQPYVGKLALDPYVNRLMLRMR